MRDPRDPQSAIRREMHRVDRRAKPGNLSARERLGVFPDIIDAQEKFRTGFRSRRVSEVLCAFPEE